MLETIREFARERLESSADCETIRRSHAEYFAGLVLRAAVRGGSTRDELRRERDNVRWAISYAAQTGDAELELSLLGLEGELMRDSMPNYRARLEELLPLAQAAPTEIRARAVGNLTFATYLMGDFTRARELAELELALAHETGEERLVGMALNSLSAPALALGDIEQARRALEQAGPLLEDVDPRSAAVNRVNLADILLTTGDYDKATRLCEEAAVMFARFGDASGRAIAEVNGATAAVLGARDDAFARVATALNGIPREDPYMLAVLIQLVAALAAGRRELEYAAGFQSTADRLRESVGVRLEPTEERVRDLVLSRLGSDWRPETTPSSADDDAAAQQAAAYLRTTAP
jgi:tetratricopeptide (TPR) repeat protein